MTLSNFEAFIFGAISTEITFGLANYLVKKYRKWQKKRVDRNNSSK